MLEIFVVILNWNNAEDTIECISSVKLSKDVNYKIICVDNNSSDGSSGRISSAHPDIIMLQTAGNLGYAGGNNFGVKKALELGATHIWILNNDTIVGQYCMKNLLEPFLNGAKTALTGSKIYFYDKKEEIWFAGGIYYPFRGVTSHYLENQAAAGVLSEKKLDYVSGCSMMISRETAEKTGVFDEKLFLLYEEIDLAQKIKKLGYTMKMCEKSDVYHKISRTLKDSPLRLYYFTRNRLYVSWKHFRPYFPFVFLWCVRWPLLPAVFKRPENIKHTLRAFIDFFTGKMGPYEEK